MAWRRRWMKSADVAHGYVMWSQSGMNCHWWYQERHLAQMAPVSRWVGIPLGLWRMDSMMPNLPLPTQAVTEHHRPLPGTKFYCLVTEVHVYEQLARGHYVKQSGRDSNLWSMDILFQISLSVLLATCHQCVLILLETSAVYKSFTYLLTYLLLVTMP